MVFNGIFGNFESTTLNSDQKRERKKNGQKF